MNIPWKLKSKLFRLLSYMPGEVLYFAQQHITKRSKVTINEPYIGWKHHLEIIKKAGSKKIIEFGAGKTLAQNLFLSTHVESQCVVDLNPMLDLQMVNAAINQLKAIGVKIDGRNISSVEELNDIYNIQYLAPYDMRKTDFDSDSFDLCISTNTLEHIPASDIRDIFIELLRILKSDGGVSAMIDYSDHYAHSDGSIGRLNYLRFSQSDWEKHNHSNHYQNRMRNDHYLRIFQSIGFSVADNHCTNYCEPDGFQPKSELLSGSETDYATTGFWHLKSP